MSDIIREAASRLRERSRRLRELLGQTAPPLGGVDLDEAHGELAGIDDDAGDIWAAIPESVTPACLDVVAVPANAVEWSDQFFEWSEDLVGEVGKADPSWQAVADLVSSLGDGIGAGCDHHTAFWDSLTE